MIVAEDLEAFLCAEADEARRAFDRICPDIRRFLLSYLSTYDLTDGERQDTTQETLIRLWKGRDSIEIRGMGAWWCLVKRIADRLVIDHYRRRGDVSLIDPEVLAEISDPQQEYIGAVGEVAGECDAILRAADACWLGPLGPDIRPEDLLAAAFLYVDDLPLDDACELLQISEEDREELERRLCEAAVILRAAYSGLHWSNDRLADEMRAKLPTPIDLGRIVELRYRNGLTAEHVARFDWCRLTVSDLEQLFAQWAEHLPFPGVAERLMRNSRRARQSVLLSEAGLWRRLVFQYWYLDQLPQRQILERMVPAAETSGFRLTSGMLTVWIGNSRLVAQLAKFIKEGGR